MLSEMNSGFEIIDSVVEVFPGLVTGEDVNGGDLVEFLTGQLKACPDLVKLIVGRTNLSCDVCAEHWQDYDDNRVDDCVIWDDCPSCKGFGISPNEEE